MYKKLKRKQLPTIGLLQANLEHIINESRRLNATYLTRIMRYQKEFPKIYEGAIKKLTDEGILSEQSQGKFAPYSKLCPEFYMGPIFNGRPLFFTNRGDCENYCNAGFAQYASTEFVEIRTL